jgi:anti-anti-sigma factor
MNITTRDVDEVKVVALEGELDLKASPEAEKQMNQLREDGVKKILIDLKKLEFISSAGLRVLLATAQEMKAAGGDLRVCSLNKTVKEVFDISGFSTLLMVFDNEAKAMVGF